MKQKPRLLLSMGDPNGIGPEIILKIFSNNSFVSKYDLKIVGPKKVLDYYSSSLDFAKIPAKRFIEIPLPRTFAVKPGKIDRQAGKISGDAVKLAACLCVEKNYDGMITLPISKESLNLGGYKFPGHTEMLTAVTKSENTVMILYSRKISVALVSSHIPLKNVSGTLNEKLLYEKILGVRNCFVSDFKIEDPKIGVLSLNPHAGDGGLLGNEESKLLNPLIAKLTAKGITIKGPFASDTYFARNLYEDFDVTIAMYHDQGLIPFKMISFDEGVNFTGGLKIVRTSPDHGTAFDIAGLGKANPNSTMEAIKLANKLAKKGKKSR